MKPATPYTESEQFQLFCQGDAAAFEALYNRYFNSVFYFAKRFLSDAQSAEDITTETFLKCWQRRNDFENIHKLTSFLYITTRNACINELRVEKRHSEKERELLQLIEEDSEEAKAWQMLKASIYQYIYEEIEKLPPQEKKIFKLAFIDGLSNEEIAQELSINNQSVRNSKTRALKSIRLALGDKDFHKLIVLLLVCPN